jgi:hypothetical protein
MMASFCGSIDGAFLGSRATVASRDARAAGILAGCGGSEEVVSVGLEMMPQL